MAIGGLIGLLDDIAALAKLSAASLDDVSAVAGRATAKAAGVVVDDTAVTPQYLQGVTAERELSLVKQIALAPSVSLVVRLVISPKSNPEGAAWSPCATLFCRA
ncbi:DUF808 domain-containing protein [Halomonas titanicae]|uniref:DUF808 family protein n=1 Tax=Vreelandella titanicae TaxID=664683 RepID=UPI001F1A4D99|nr:DUF808 family protein [Halomonas titanicae]MCE7521195.1 DUF808 domain-containing protein [Halomonas titanicae]